MILIQNLCPTRSGACSDFWMAVKDLVVSNKTCFSDNWVPCSCFNNSSRGTNLVFSLWPANFAIDDNKLRCNI